MDRPRVAMGASLLEGADSRVWGLPSVSGLVTKWKLDRKGHYVGAQISVVTDMRRVDGEVPDSYPKVTSVLDVLFIGVAYKDLGAGVTSKASTVSVRASGMGV